MRMYYERRDRPGVTHMIGSLCGIRIAGTTPEGGGESGGDEPVAEFAVSHNGAGLVTLTIPGCTVSHDGNGTVTLSGLTVPVTDDGNGNITIGG